MSAFTFLLQILGYDDVEPTNNPSSRPIDYSMTQANIPVENAQTESFNVAPGASVVVFDGIRETSIGDDTAFDLTLNLADPSVYRIAFTGGTDPEFRQTRGVDTTHDPVTMTVLSNLSIQVDCPTTNVFSNVAVGDVVFIPGAKTGDPDGPFSDLNSGFWSVLAVPSNTRIIMGRDPADVWEGVAETVTTTSVDDFQVFSSDGVQVGDTVDISAGFSQPAQRAFDITAVTYGWIEIRSTAPLGPETGVVPGILNFVVYTQRKRFVGIRTNQEIVVRYNNDFGDTNRVEPLLAGVAGMEGSEHKFGSVWKLEIYNRSTVRANVRVATAE
jgi:hypothetical protein